MALPPEVMCKVLRALTNVPEALDTSFAMVEDEDGPSTSASIRASMRDKIAVSLVSKSFHDLAIRYLFEVVTVRRLTDIRPLAKLLRRSCGAGRPTRGHWVRRLEVDLSKRDNVPKDDDECSIWNLGAITLYGLLPECMNLQVLLLSLPSPSTKLFRIPEALCQTLASCNGAMLRRLELRGQLYLPLMRLERTLHSFPLLEVIKVEGLSDLEPAYDDLRDRTNYPGLFMVLANCRRGLTQDELDEYQLAHERAHWLAPAPSTLPHPPAREHMPIPHTIVLSHLHTLALSAFSARTARWALPSLRSASLAGQRPPQDLLLALHSTLVPSAALLTHLSYTGPPLPLWPLVDALPALVVLDVRATAHVHVRSALAAPHGALKRVVLRQGRYVGAELADALEELERLVRMGRVPRLEGLEVRLDEGAWWEGEQNELEQGFRAMQAAVELLAFALKRVTVFVGSEAAE